MSRVENNSERLDETIKGIVFSTRKGKQVKKTYHNSGQSISLRRSSGSAETVLWDTHKEGRYVRTLEYLEALDREA